MRARRRICAKVLLVDRRNRVLLFSGIDRTLPDDPPVWFPVGGGANDGEPVEAAAIRETVEETGFHIDQLGPVVSRRRAQWTFEGTLFDQDEAYFLVRTTAFDPVDHGWTDVEKATVVGHRWWSLDELRQTDEVVYPDDLVRLLERIL
ncbi:MAG: NUDIX hydrolase [Acidimicrobiales bacterium]